MIVVRSFRSCIDFDDCEYENISYVRTFQIITNPLARCIIIGSVLTNVKAITEDAFVGLEYASMFAPSTQRLSEPSQEYCKKLSACRFLAQYENSYETVPKRCAL
jgi:hypothetical protein